MWWNVGSLLKEVNADGDLYADYMDDICRTLRFDTEIKKNITTCNTEKNNIYFLMSSSAIKLKIMTNLVK